MSSPDFSLIETMRYTPGEGILRLALHMARLKNSAVELGFLGADEVEEKLLAEVDKLGSTSSGERGLVRLRLELAADGKMSLTATEFRLQPPDTVWQYAVAETRLMSSDPLTRHKTTRRALYDAARAEFSSDAAQEVLLLNERGELVEGTISNIFLDDGAGILETPPLASGCLDGVLRRSLLDTGKAREKNLTLADLIGGRAYVGNSLRGLIRLQTGF